MKISKGTLYSSGTITANGNSGWRKMSGTGGVRSDRQGFDRSSYHIVPANLAGDELLDVTIEFGFDVSGTGGATVVTFTQVTSTNAAETQQSANPTPDYVRIVWVVAGSAISMDFIVYYTGVN